MEWSDEQLIKRIKGGDNDAFEPLVERYKKTIFNLMYRYCDSVEDAADMTQDVFCRVFQKIELYQEQRKFFSWLYTLALNYARDWRKKQHSNEQKTIVIGRDETTANNPTESRTESNQQIEKLMLALESLAHDRRELVILRYRHERSIRELSEIFDISESAVKMRLHRALEDLGKKLSG